MKYKALNRKMFYDYYAVSSMLIIVKNERCWIILFVPASMISVMDFMWDEADSMLIGCILWCALGRSSGHAFSGLASTRQFLLN